MTTPMNRETRRMARKAGMVDADGQAVSARRERRPQQPRQREERTSPGDYIKEVRSELRKVAWPTRDEVINYSLVVAALVIVLTAMVALLDYLFGAGVLALFER